MKHTKMRISSRFLPNTETNPITGTSANSTAATTIFINGPADAILPVSSALALPRNITAPGAANTNPVNTAMSNDNNRPKGKIRNSDHNPSRCAMNLCANSCKINPVNIPKSDNGNANRNPETLNPKIGG